MKLLEPTENELVGSIVINGGRAEFDEVAKRINWLVEHSLNHLSDDESGWLSLYENPQDGRYWERTFPNGENHGGGAPKLSLIDREKAKVKYHI